MANITAFIAGQQAMEREANLKHVVSNFIDFTKTNAGASDTVELLRIPKGALVTSLMVVIHTAAGGTSTMTVGDAGSANGYDASVNLNAAAKTLTKSAEADAYGLAGRLYNDAEGIIFGTLSAHANAASKFTVIAEYLLSHHLPV